METYLIPTDFSDTSVNAAKYAAAQSLETKPAKLILVHSYYVSEYETLLPSANFTITTNEFVEEETSRRLKMLEKLKHKLAGITGSGIEIETHFSALPVLRAVHEAIKLYQATLIVIGSNGGGTDDSDLGSNALVLSKTSPVPVLVIPPKTRWKHISRLVMACDFKKVNEVIPMSSLRRIFGKLSPLELLVLNVDPSGTTDIAEESSVLQKMLADFNPQYYFIKNTSVLKGIVEFASKKHAQVVIALPRKYSFFEGLLHASLTEQLADHTNIPVLILKDN